jgi:hypothetical protein
MKGLMWRSLRSFTPQNNRTIMIADHEGNFIPGIWKNKFIPFLEIPIGFKVKWIYIKVEIEEFGDMEIIDCENIYLENGSKLHINEIYDFNDPVKINLS